MASRKRPRNNGSPASSTMRRTTSLSELAPPTRAARGGGGGGSPAPAPPVEPVAGFGDDLRRYSIGCFPVTETAAFLKVCGFCSRGLGPGRDTYIYMGEVAFCSQECRQNQMNYDELMESKRGGSDQSGKGSTIAAA